MTSMLTSPVLPATQDGPGRAARKHHLMQLPLCELARLVRQETDHFLKKSAPSDQLPGLALFARAIRERNDDAWSIIYEQYAPLVLSWITRQPGSFQLVQAEEPLSLVNAVFARFYKAVTPEKLERFSSLSGLLKYLQMCAHSVVADAVRARRAEPRKEPLESLADEPAPADFADEVTSRLATTHVWQLILAELHPEAERMVRILTIMYGMEPTEIALASPHLFPSREDVYRVKRSVIERLRRKPDLRTLLREAT